MKTNQTVNTKKAWAVVRRGRIVFADAYGTGLSIALIYAKKSDAIAEMEKEEGESVARVEIREVGR
jgi:hypothetical protein